MKNCRFEPGKLLPDVQLRFNLSFDLSSCLSSVNTGSLVGRSAQSKQGKWKKYAYTGSVAMRNSMSKEQEMVKCEMSCD